MSLFFSYDANNGFQRWETAVQARDEALRAFDCDAAEAQDGWAEEVEETCWGRVLGRVVQTQDRPKLDSDCHEGDCTLDFALTEAEREELALLRGMRDAVESFLDAEHEEAEYADDVLKKLRATVRIYLRATQVDFLQKRVAVLSARIAALTAKAADGGEGKHG